MGQDRSPHQTEPQALPLTETTGNLSEKAQVAGGQARGPEANRLLTLEHSGSGTPAQTGDGDAEAASSHPCPVLELPPAWPLGCGSEDVPAFCFICFHREEEEELLEEIPLQRSVPVVGSRGDKVRAQGSGLGHLGAWHTYFCVSWSTVYHPLPPPCTRLSDLSPGCHHSLVPVSSILTPQ